MRQAKEAIKNNEQTLIERDSMTCRKQKGLMKTGEQNTRDLIYM